MATNYKVDLTKEIKDAITRKIVIDSEGAKCLYLENSRLDFSNHYHFLGFRGKKQVILGEVVASHPTKLKKCVGFVSERNGIYSLWTERYNYSLRLEVR